MIFTNLISLLLLTNIITLNQDINCKFDKKDTLEITYNLQFKPKNTEDSPVKYTTAKLFITDSSSYYLDELSVSQIKELNNGTMPNGGIPNIRHIVYKNYTKNSVIVSQRIATETFGYQNQLMEIDSWKIKSETKEILGFQCNKATTTMGGRDWIAWFTTEVPVREGPYTFYGLPGLIVNLESTDKDYVFKMEGVQKFKEDSYFPAPNTPTLVSRIHFLDLQRNVASRTLAKLKSITVGGDIVMKKNGVEEPISDLETDIRKEDETRNEIELK